MWHPRSKLESLVGLDIGSTSVKLLELSKHDGRHRVEAFGVEPLPPNAVVDRNISDLDSVGEAIRRLADRAGPRARRAATAVPDSAAITRIVEMDASLSDDALESRITSEAGRHIPFPLEEVAMDFEVQNLSERNPDQVEVLLAVCRRDEVEKREGAMRLGGLRPHVVEMEGQAIRRAAAASGPTDDGAGRPALLTVLDIGADATRLHAFDGAGPGYVQEQHFGGRRLTAELRRRYGWSDAEAELALRRRDLPTDADETVLQHFRAALAGEVERALRQFQATADRPVGHVLLAGGATALPGLADLLGHTLPAGAGMADPCAGMTLAARVDGDALAAYAPAMLTACGLALRAFDP